MYGVEGRSLTAPTSIYRSSSSPPGNNCPVSAQLASQTRMDAEYEVFYHQPKPESPSPNSSPAQHEPVDDLACASTSSPLLLLTVLADVLHVCHVAHGLGHEHDANEQSFKNDLYSESIGLLRIAKSPLILVHAESYALQASDTFSKMPKLRM